MLKGKTALVTGASKGIGKSIAVALAKEGCNIILNYVGSEDLAQDVSKEIKNLGVEVFAVKADVSKMEDVDNLIQTTKEKFNSLDIVVNNAGIAKDRSIKNMTQEEWQNVIDVNLTGVFNVSKAAAEILNDNGRIINISSIVGECGNFGQTNYAASKAGVIGFTKALAKELAKRKITVNSIVPGFIKTEMTDNIPFIRKIIIGKMIPLKDLGEPEDIANAVVFLASPKSRYITGESLHVTGGLNF
jgi:3-oxoacyl-[acyl-carrier protein] reductase